MIWSAALVAKWEDQKLKAVTVRLNKNIRKRLANEYTKESTKTSVDDQIRR